MAHSSVPCDLASSGCTQTPSPNPTQHAENSPDPAKEKGLSVHSIKKAQASQLGAGLLPTGKEEGQHTARAKRHPKRPQGHHRPGDPPSLGNSSQ